MRSSSKIDGHAAGDESHLAEALDQGIKAEIQLAFEDLGVELKGGLGTGDVRSGLADHLHRAGGIAALVALEMHFAIALDFHLTPFGKGIDRRDAHAVQAAGDLVAAAAKLAAGVQDGHHHFQGRLFHLRVHIDRDAAPIIL